MRLSPFDLWLLDCAALDYCELRDFADRQWLGVGPESALERYGYRRIAAGIQRLLKLGLVELVDDRLGTPVRRDVGDLRGAIGATARESGVFGFGLTPEGATTWERYRRPNWEAFVVWLESDGGVSCVGGDRRAVALAVSLAADAASLRVSTGWKPHPVEVDAWRETYWRPWRTAHRVDLDGGMSSTEGLRRAWWDWGAVVTSLVAVQGDSGWRPRSHPGRWGLWAWGMFPADT